MLDTNLAILKLTKRAEQVDTIHLLKTFVDTGSILTLMSNVDSQVVYGRRGTGTLSLICKKPTNLPLADRWSVFANSELSNPHLVAEGENNEAPSIHEASTWNTMQSI